MLILTLILLSISVDFKTHVNISVSHDANLGARFSLFITNTTANRKPIWLSTIWEIGKLGNL